MKFIHLSDLHLEKRVNEYSMLEDQEYILKKIINVVDAEKPNGVIIAGDVYDKSVPAAEAVQLFNNFLVQLAKRKLEVFVISGNSQFIEMFGDPVDNTKKLPVCQLSEHIRFLTSGSREWAKYHADDGEWFITIKNVKDCKISLDDVQCIVAPHNAEADRTRLKEGDLLISITADLGRTGVVTKEIADHGAYINQHLTCIRLDRDVLNPLYVAFFMESDAGKKQFFEKNLSSVKAGLNLDSIRTLRLLVPPLADQERFIAFVEQSDKSKYCLQRAQASQLKYARR